MPNIIIQNYLNDKGIDFSKRQGLINALKSGQKEEDVAAMLNKKYGNRYGSLQESEIVSSAGLPSMLSPNVQRSQLSETGQPLNTPKPEDKSLGGQLQKAGKEFVTGAVTEVPRAGANVAGATLETLGNIPGSPLKFASDITKAAQSGIQTSQTGEYQSPTQQPGIQEQVVSGGEQLKSAVSDAYKQSGVDTETWAGKAGGVATDIAAGLLASKGLPSQENFWLKSAQNTAAAVAPMEGRLPNIPELAVGAALDKVFNGIGRVFKGGTTGATQEVESAVKDLTKQGVKEQDAYLLSQLTPEEQVLFQEYTQAGLKKLENRLAPDVFDVASKDVIDFMSIAKKEISSVGKQLSQKKQELATQILNKQDLRPALDEIMSAYNIKATKKGLDFAGSELNNAGQAKSIVEDLYKQIRSKKTLSLRDVEGITGQIDQATKFLKKEGDGVGVTALGDLKAGINQAVGNIDPEFAVLNQRYAELIKPFKQIKKAGNVKLDTGKYVFNPKQIIRRSTSNVDAKPAEAMEAMRELGQKLGVEAPKNLQMRGHLAELAERITGTKAPTSLGGIVESTGERLKDKAVTKAVGKIPVVGQMAEAAKEYFTANNPRIKQDVEKVLSALTKAEKVAVKKGEASLSKGDIGALKDITSLISKVVLQQTQEDGEQK